MGDGGAAVIVVCCSQSGSPGVSVWSVLTAGLWPSDDDTERVIVEADVDGGVMCTRYQLRPSTEDLIAAAPRLTGPLDGVEVSMMAVRVAEQVWMVPSPTAAAAARRQWSATDATRSVASMAAGDRRVWLFDVGRADPDGLMSPLFGSAACVVVFVRGESEDLARVRDRVVAVRRSGSPVVIAVSGTSGHDRREVADFLGGAQVVELPSDGRLVEDSRRVWSSQRSRRRNVWTAGTSLAGAISEVLEHQLSAVASMAPATNLGLRPSWNGGGGAQV